MSESIYKTAMRTHACGELTTEHADTAVVLCGWVASRRDHGGVTFIDLRDREGVVQVVFHPEEAAEAHTAAQRLSAEDVVRVTGTVRNRPAGMANPQLPTGEVEVVAATLEVLAEAETPPFPIEDRIEAGEELRLRYRYLDLRRPEMTAALRIRHRINAITRDHMDALGFLEVETPLLTRSTPEGARDFLVPSRLWPGSFYALPQSPQQLKQLLMVAGQDRYYQIVRCLRDEAPRADRSFEFTQLDVEMSFADQEDVFAVIEPLYARYVREIHGVEVPTPFPRIPYDEMLARFGTDKPDLRYEGQMEIVDLTPLLRQTRFKVFRSVIEAGGVVKAIAVPWEPEFSRRQRSDLEQMVKGRGAGGLVSIHLVGLEDWNSPVRVHIEEDFEAIKKATGAVHGDVLLLVADTPDRVNSALDGLRRHLADRLGLIPEGKWRYVWYTDPPLFDWSDEEGKWVSNHHPFTAPATDDLDPKTAKSKGYDLVLNGYEVGGGSIRIHRPEVQEAVFAVLGLTEAEIEEKFGHLIRAFRYGAPPHGGIAMGLDRIVMLMAGQETLREVTAFPKAQSGADPLTGAPAPVDEAQLRELALRVIPPKVEQEAWPRAGGEEAPMDEESR